MSSVFVIYVRRIVEDAYIIRAENEDDAMMEFSERKGHPDESKTLSDSIESIVELDEVSEQ